MQPSLRPAPHVGPAIELALVLRSAVLYRRFAVSKRGYGILAGVIGSAIGAWWWKRQRAASMGAAERNRGTVIFHNTPTPTPLSSEGVI